MFTGLALNPNEASSLTLLMASVLIERKPPIARSTSELLESESISSEVLITVEAVLAGSGLGPFPLDP